MGPPAASWEFYHDTSAQYIVITKWAIGTVQSNPFQNCVNILSNCSEPMRKTQDDRAPSRIGFPCDEIWKVCLVENGLVVRQNQQRLPLQRILTFRFDEKKGICRLKRRKSACELRTIHQSEKLIHIACVHIESARVPVFKPRRLNPQTSERICLQFCKMINHGHRFLDTTTASIFACQSGIRGGGQNTFLQFEPLHASKSQFSCCLHTSNNPAHHAVEKSPRFFSVVAIPTLLRIIIISSLVQPFVSTDIMPPP